MAVLKELIRRNGLILKLGRFDVLTVVSTPGDFTLQGTLDSFWRHL